jgi:hypothetical protein
MTTLVQGKYEISKVRMAGRVARGILIGMLLVPAFCGLISLVGGISTFAYQGF